MLPRVLWLRFLGVVFFSLIFCLLAHTWVFSSYWYLYLLDLCYFCLHFSCPFLPASPEGFWGLRRGISLNDNSLKFLYLSIFLFQDSLFIKPPKKSTLLWRMVVLIFSMVCGVFICSICLKQISVHTSGRLLNVQVMRPCEPPYIDPSEKPFMHFPNPKTFSR